MNKKRVFGVIVMLLLVVTIFTCKKFYVKADSEKITLKLHYLRADNSYDGWNVWMWEDNSGSAALNFTGSDENGVFLEKEFDSSVQKAGSDENGVFLEKEFDSSVQKVGFIVRLNDWEAKDMDCDRFIDLEKVTSGTVDVYVTSGKEEFETNYDNAYIIDGIWVKNAFLNNDDNVEFELSESVQTLQVEDVAIKGDEEKIGIKSIVLNDDKISGVITLENKLDYSKKYYLVYNGIEKEIKMPDYYSTSDFENSFTYDGNDLGATWTKEKTTFKVWAPTADNVMLVIYDSSSGSVDDVRDKMKMTKQDKGVWDIEIAGDLNKTYYAYEVEIEGKTNIAADPYAKSAGVNGEKSMVIALDGTDPKGWDKDKRQTTKNITDSVIYELHVRDFSSYSDSGIKNVGKYLAFTEKGTKTSTGIPTGINYLKNLGITHVHILPTYDFGSIDENTCEGYNWGYDPVNYNVPEGSYSTDPANGEIRVNEYKQMVQALHDEGIGVVMDVVYNHTYSKDFCFNKIVPDYFYRGDSNGTGCGNDVASERAMVSKYIVDSVVYLAKEYHIDGFRFDLMGVLDVDTMNEIRQELDKIDPDIMVYGEGWTLNTKPTKSVDLAIQSNSKVTPNIAYFSDTLRDALRGNVFDNTEKGYVSGNLDKLEDIKTSLLGAPSWVTSPSQVINYDSCHDNMTIWDRLQTTCSDVTEKERIQYNKLSAGIVFTSQGIPFMMSGEEFLRTKLDENGSMVENSYKSSDTVNMLDYSRVTKYNDVYNYYKGLIEFRKNHSALRLMTADTVSNSISMIENLDEGVIAYKIDTDDENLVVVYNPNKKDTNIKLSKGKWGIYIDGDKAGNKALRYVKNSVEVKGVSCYVFAKENGKTNCDSITDTSTSTVSDKQENINNKTNNKVNVVTWIKKLFNFVRKLF